ncbi:unnamed protein product [Nezara viridula]|uniref:Uncharacterized protein n=1 Tax=Nezara viridula TaxID=85310 RepID=A0A9P0HB94_NEZVI|nr:unnamed protein product [Nezara viridula]
MPLGLGSMEYIAATIDMNRGERHSFTFILPSAATAQSCARFDWSEYVSRTPDSPRHRAIIKIAQEDF